MSNETVGLWQYFDGQLMKYNNLPHHLTELSKPVGINLYGNGAWRYYYPTGHSEFGCERKPGKNV